MAKKSATMMVEVEVSRVIDGVVERLSYDHRLSEKVEAMVEERLRARLGPAIDKEVADAVTPLIAAIVKNGWVEAVPYGEPKRHTIEARVAAFFDTNVPDPNHRGYGHSAQKSRFHHLVDEMLDKALREDFGKLLVEARDRFKKTVDDTMVTKLAEVLKVALGVR